MKIFLYTQLFDKQMNLILPLSALVLVGCQATKISPYPDVHLTQDAEVLLIKGDAVSTTNRFVDVEFSNNFRHPFSHILSFGLVPVHCESTYDYHVVVTKGNKSAESTVRYSVKSMQGWLATLYLISPNWKLGWSSGQVDSELMKNTALNRISNKQIE